MVKDHLEPIFKDLSSNRNMDEKMKGKIRNMLYKYKKCFSKNKNDMGFCPLIEHEIIVKEGESPKQTYYRLPLGLEELSLIHI